MAWQLALAGIGLGLQAFGMFKGGQAEKDAAAAQARAARAGADLQDYNAAVAELQGYDATIRGMDDESRFRQSVNALVGAQRAGFAAGNLDVTFGSAVDVQSDTALLGELDALTIRQNAAREAWGYRVEAADLRKRADIARKEGVYLEAAGRARASTAAIAAAGAVASGVGSLMVARSRANLPRTTTA